MTKMPRDQWKRIVDSGFVAIVTVLAFLSFFVWRLLTSESDVKFHINLINDIWSTLSNFIEFSG